MIIEIVSTDKFDSLYPNSVDIPWYKIGNRFKVIQKSTYSPIIDPTTGIITILDGYDITINSYGDIKFISKEDVKLLRDINLDKLLC